MSPSPERLSSLSVPAYGRITGLGGHRLAVTARAILAKAAANPPITQMFSYSQNDLYCEQVALADLAHRAGTPAYVYSSQAILANYRAYDEAFGDLPHSVCYAVKANSSLAVLGLLAKAGAGFDIVSGGELFRVLQAGGTRRRWFSPGWARPRTRWNTRWPAGFTASTASRNRSWRSSTPWPRGGE